MNKINRKLGKTIFYCNLLLISIVFSLDFLFLSHSQYSNMWTAVQQFYQTRVIDEFVLRGNAGLLKCNLPSFVADFIDVEAWIADDGLEILRNNTDFGIEKDVKFIKTHVESHFPSIQWGEKNAFRMRTSIETIYYIFHKFLHRFKWSP